MDGCNSTQYCAGLLTTVVKNIPDAVRDAVLKGAKKESLKVEEGSVGTLQNNGVSIAPYHDFDSKIDAALKAEVEQAEGRHHLRQGQGRVAGAAQVIRSPAAA